MKTSDEPLHLIGNPGRHLFWIDVLRGIAILMVLFHHLGPPVTPDYTPDKKSLVHVLHLVGWAGVDLFFVISGALIGGLIFRQIRSHQEFSLGRFYARRILRIFPSYFFLLLLIYIAPSSAGKPDSLFAPSLVFLQNYNNYLPHVFWSHTWSLCVEEHFYLGFPLLAFVLFKTGRFTLLPYFALAILPISLLLRVYHQYHFSPEYISPLFFTHTRLDEIAMGVLIAYAYSFRPELVERIIARPRRLLLVSFLFLTPLGSLELKQSPFLQTFGISMNAVGFGGIVLLALSVRKPGRLGLVLLWPLAKIGGFVYTIYLVHPMLFQLDFFRVFAHPLYEMLTGFFGAIVSTDHARVLSYFIITIALGILFAFTVERPMLRLRNRFWPERRPRGEDQGK